MDARRELLLEIASCPIVKSCLLERESVHRCAEIVRYQWAEVSIEERLAFWEREHQVPEPWVGHLEQAPILFLSSNPSLSGRRRPGERARAPRRLEQLGLHRVEEHPSLGRAFEAVKWEWDDDQIDDCFSAAFDVFMTEDGTAEIRSDETAAAAVPYWQSAKALADLLLGRSARPGHDYALSEVVHCKSPNEIGVGDAAHECVPRYLRRTLALSPARVLVVVGRHARQAIRREYHYPNAPQVSEPIEIEGRERRVVFVAGPAARRAKYPKTVTEQDALILREWLSAPS